MEKNKKCIVNSAKKKDKRSKAVWVTPKVQRVSIEDNIAYPLVMQSNDSGE